MTAPRELPTHPPCFVCGGQNPCGTRMAWVQAGDGVEGRYLGAERHCGFEGIMHGGVLAALLDECAGWAAALRSRAMCFTGELKVRYLRPAPTGRELLIRGRCPEESAEGAKYLLAVAEIVDAEGTLYASGEGKFFPMPPATSDAVLVKLALPEAARERSVAEYLWREPPG